MRLIYVVSDVNKALAFEWTAFHLKSRHHLTFVLIGERNTILEQFLNKINVACHVISDDEFPGHLRKWFKLLWLLFKLKPDIVHTHLWRANILGLSAAWFLRVKKRIHTRHHATIHYTDFLSGRKWDVINNWLSTHIIAISKNIEEILIRWDKSNASKVHLIHHGFDINYFEPVPLSRIEHIRSLYGLSNFTFPVVGVIARYIKWKGIQYIIPAFSKVLQQFPGAVLVLTNTKGPYEYEIKQLLNTLPKNSFIEIEFEEDLAALYRMMDVYVHVPVDSRVEAFGQTYIESLICEIPSVFTLSGVASEFIINEFNALVVDYRDVDTISESIMRIIKDKELAFKIIKNGKESVRKFSIDKMIVKLNFLYG